MIRYPDDIAAEMDVAAYRFFDNLDPAMENMEQEEFSKMLNDYVYEHCSERTKRFLDKVKAAYACAEKRGIMI